MSHAPPPGHPIHFWVQVMDTLTSFLELGKFSVPWARYWQVEVRQVGPLARCIMWRLKIHVVGSLGRTSE